MLASGFPVPIGETLSPFTNPEVGSYSSLTYQNAVSNGEGIVTYQGYWNSPLGSYTGTDEFYVKQNPDGTWGSPTLMWQGG